MSPPRLALAALLLVASACEADQVGRQAPKLVLVPEADSVIDFGTVTVGDLLDPARILAKNDGNAVLLFSDIRFEGTGRFELTGKVDSLGVGVSQSMSITMAATEPGPVDASLVFESNDPDLPVARLRLVAQVGERCRLQLSPPNETFLIDEVKTITLSNPSTADCRVVTISVDETFFEIMDPPALPLMLAGGDSVPLRIRHTDTAFRGRPVRPLVARATGAGEAQAILSGQNRVSCLSLSRDEVQFFGIEPGATSVSSVEVISECEHDVDIINLAVASADGGFGVPDTVPLTVTAGGRKRVQITFSPVPGPNFFANGTLTIETDDFADRYLRLGLRGFINRPSGTVHPRELRFEPVVYEPSAGPGSPSTCASDLASVDVINTGNIVLTIREFTRPVDRQFDLQFVEIDGQIITDLVPPFDVPPGQRASFNIRYRPNGVGTHTTQMTLRHDGEDRSVVIGLSGSGEDRAQITEVFQQPTELQVDILWAIDASCSMGEEQQKLIDNLSQFVDYADAQGANYQMAVIEAEEVSLDAGELRQCRGHPRVIRSDYQTSAVRDQVFECLFDLGINGVGIESGMGGARVALNRALAEPQNPAINPNAGLIRPAAELVIVAISDEDDQASLPNVVLRDFFYSAKDGQRNKVSFHAIAGPLSSGCAAAQAGTRYADMARQTNGQFYSICENDWSPLLQNLGLDVFTPENQWYLSRPADESTLVVTVDGVVLPSDPFNGWVYEPSRRVVLFTGAGVPMPGAEIVVTYMPGCAG